MSSVYATKPAAAATAAAKQRAPFTRTSSLERIKNFNLYICSQNFYILPAILAWLKSSQVNLKCLFASIRTILFYVCMQLQRRLFTLTVYFTITFIFLQLAVCLLYLSYAIMPIGFLFMITCLYTIASINLYCLRHQQQDSDGEQRVRRPRLSRKDYCTRRLMLHKF